MDRRDFLIRAACGAGLVTAAGLAGCKSGREGAAGEPMPTQAELDSRIAKTKMGLNPPDKSGRVSNNRVFENGKPPGGVHIAVATKKAPGELVRAAVAAFGGMGGIVKKGDRVVIKPNLAWGRTPETGANTSPEVLKAVIELAKEAGARDILVLEHSCDKSSVTFDMTGAQDVCRAAGVKLVSLDNEALFREMPVKWGTNIRDEKFPTDLMDCDVYINLPCLKHHAATNLTACLKNQMGAVFDPQRYHKEGSQKSGGLGLHQNIADLATALWPTVNIVDATRVLTTNGPKGPGNVEKMDTVYVSHDMVAADMLGAQMLKYTEKDVPHIKLAADAGVGRMDLAALKVARV